MASIGHGPANWLRWRRPPGCPCAAGFPFSVHAGRRAPQWDLPGECAISPVHATDTGRAHRRKLMLTTILIVVLILALRGAADVGHSRSWGYAPVEASAYAVDSHHLVLDWPHMTAAASHRRSHRAPIGSNRRTRPRMSPGGGRRHPAAQHPGAGRFSALIRCCRASHRGSWRSRYDQGGEHISAGMTWSCSSDGAPGVAVVALMLGLGVPSLAAADLPAAWRASTTSGVRRSGPAGWRSGSTVNYPPADEPTASGGELPRARADAVCPLTKVQVGGRSVRTNLA
jgi:hypothetical protein